MIGGSSTVPLSSSVAIQRQVLPSKRDSGTRRRIAAEQPDVLPLPLGHHKHLLAGLVPALPTPSVVKWPLTQGPHMLCVHLGGGPELFPHFQ